MRRGPKIVQSNSLSIRFILELKYPCVPNYKDVTDYHRSCKIPLMSVNKFKQVHGEYFDNDSLARKMTEIGPITVF